MKKIRNKVFETNSSSIHSVTVYRKNDNSAIDYLNAHGPVLVVSPKYFGWDIETYTDVEDKLSYAYSLACCFDSDEFLERKEFIKNILEEIGFKPVFYSNTNKCYVDHFGCWENGFLQKLFSDKEFFTQFVFNNKSFVLTGNDNTYNGEPELGRNRPADYPETEYFDKNN